MLGARVAPMIEAAAKITDPLAPVRACAAAKRSTLLRKRGSFIVPSLAVTSIIGISARASPRNLDFVTLLMDVPRRSTGAGGRGLCAGVDAQVNRIPCC